MDSGEGAVAGHRNFLRIRLRIRRFVRVELLCQLLDVREYESRLVHFGFEQFAQRGVQFVPHVARPPRRTAFGHEAGEEHAVQHPSCKIAIL